MRYFYKLILMTVLVTISLQAQYKHGSDVTQAGEILNWCLISNGGTSLSASGYTLEGSIAQPITGTSSNQIYTADHGYWYSGLENKLDAHDEPEDNEFINVFPTVTNSGIITVRSSLTGNVNLEIFNYIGILLYSETIAGQDKVNSVISLEPLKLASGLYFIVLSNEKHRLAGSFINNY